MGPKDLQGRDLLFFSINRVEVRLAAIGIDRVCINQDDTDERSRQILRMKDLYLKAALTVAWLGTDEGGSGEMAFKFMRILEDKQPLAEFNDLLRGIDSWLPGAQPTMPELVAFQNMIWLPCWWATG